MLRYIVVGALIFLVVKFIGQNPDNTAVTGIERGLVQSHMFYAP